MQGCRVPGALPMNVWSRMPLHARAAQQSCTWLAVVSGFERSEISLMSLCANWKRWISATISCIGAGAGLSGFAGHVLPAERQHWQSADGQPVSRLAAVQTAPLMPSVGFSGACHECSIRFNWRLVWSDSPQRDLDEQLALRVCTGGRLSLGGHFPAEVSLVDF